MKELERAALRCHHQNKRDLRTASSRDHPGNVLPGEKLRIEVLRPDTMSAAPRCGSDESPVYRRACHQSEQRGFASRRSAPTSFWNSPAPGAGSMKLR